MDKGDSRTLLGANREMCIVIRIQRPLGPGARFLKGGATAAAKSCKQVEEDKAFGLLGLFGVFGMLGGFGVFGRYLERAIRKTGQSLPAACETSLTRFQQRVLKVPTPVRNLSRSLLREGPTKSSLEGPTDEMSPSAY